MCLLLLGALLKKKKNLVVVLQENQSISLVMNACITYGSLHSPFYSLPFMWFSFFLVLPSYYTTFEGNSRSSLKQEFNYGSQHQWK